MEPSAEAFEQSAAIALHLAIGKLAEVFDIPDEKGRTELHQHQRLFQRITTSAVQCPVTRLGQLCQLGERSRFAGLDLDQLPGSGLSVLIQGELSLLAAVGFLGAAARSFGLVVPENGAGFSAPSFLGLAPPGSFAASLVPRPRNRFRSPSSRFQKFNTTTADLWLRSTPGTIPRSSGAALTIGPIIAHPKPRAQSATYVYRVPAPCRSRISDNQAADNQTNKSIETT